MGEDTKKSILGQLNSASSFRNMKASELSQAAGLCESDSSYPQAREAIRELLDEGHCIGSSPTGYFLMNSGKEVQVYLNSLLKRQLGISKRIQAVYDSAVEGGLL